MIQAQDLRIGNWIKGGLHFCKVDAILDYPAKKLIAATGEHLGAELPFDEWEGIPLSPSILSKAGFERYTDTECFIKKYNQQGEFLLFSGSTLVGQANDIPADEFYYFFNRIAHCIKYLHQLQNLIKALTGTDIEINL